MESTSSSEEKAENPTSRLLCHTRGERLAGRMAGDLG